MKSEKLLKSFIKYCEENPEQRFWQALTNWAGADYIYIQKDKEPLKDVFYFEDYIFKNQLKDNKEFYIVFKRKFN